MDLTKKQYGGNLTDSQHNAMLELTKWYASNEPIYTLKGAAGTGKTYLLNIFLREVASHASCVTAPTHKAVRIIERMTGKKGRTIHSLHGLRPDVSLEDFNIDDVKFSAIGKSTLGNYKIIPCDECGMINSSLDTLNETRAKQFHTKILYLGDDLQLPPVREHMSKTFIKYKTSELTELVRQKETNPLIEPLSIIRDDIKYNTNKFMPFMTKHKGNISNDEGFKVLSLKEFQSTMVTYFSDERFNTDLDYCRYLAYENDNIIDWNKYVRKITNTHSTSNDDIINEDDMFTSYKTIVDEYLNPIIINSDDYIVADVRRYKNEYDMETFIVSFKNTSTMQVSRSVQVVDHTDKATLLIYYTKLKVLLHQAKYAHATERGSKWKAFFNFKNNHLSMISFTIYGDDREKLGGVMKDIDYGFGITIHKSQGSTYNNVFLNLMNVNKMLSKGYINTKMRNQLIYVALSRASNKAYILL